MTDSSVRVMSADKQPENSEVQMREAALAYELFLRDNPDERAAMEEWESAPLVDSIRSHQP